VAPTFRSGSQIDVSNYRPISLLSVFNRILEKLMCKQLLRHINEHKILNDNQFGFRKNHSTTQAILSITNSIQNAIEENEFSCGIFLDLKKAFDCVNHEILLSKLHHYGTRWVAGKWFYSYLSNRKQYVTIGGISSEPHPIHLDVPQGSLLGPLLFLLYINDICYSSNFSLFIYLLMIVIYSTKISVFIHLKLQSIRNYQMSILGLYAQIS